MTSILTKPIQTKVALQSSGKVQIIFLQSLNPIYRFLLVLIILYAANSKSSVFFFGLLWYQYHLLNSIFHACSDKPLIDLEIVFPIVLCVFVELNWIEFCFSDREYNGYRNIHTLRDKLDKSWLDLFPSGSQNPFCCIDENTLHSRASRSLLLRPHYTFDHHWWQLSLKTFLSV